MQEDLKLFPVSGAPNKNKLEVKFKKLNKTNKNVIIDDFLYILFYCFNVLLEKSIKHKKHLLTFFLPCTSTAVSITAYILCEVSANSAAYVSTFTL